jgi:hypothetical protein
MPVLPPTAAPPYDTVNTCLTSARARLSDRLDTLQPVSGRLLDNTEFFTLQSLNSGWRNMQDRLADNGYAALTNEAVIANLPAVHGLDPSTQVWLNWDGYFDGANLFQGWKLPADFTHPIKIWERWSGQNAEFRDPPMEKVLDGLPAFAKATAMRFWEWRGDSLYMPGSQRVEDLRIRYVRYLPDFRDIGNQRWFTQPIPIVRGSDALSWYLCAEVAGSRGDIAGVQRFCQYGDGALTHIFNLDVKADQRVNVQRRPRGRSGRNWF